jgi:hypothetical protein
MVKRDGKPPVDAGASSRSLTIARIIDRLCRAPGSYAVVLTVPAHRRAPWLVEFYRLEAMRELTIGRGSSTD